MGSKVGHQEEVIVVRVYHVGGRVTGRAEQQMTVCQWRRRRDDALALIAAVAMKLLSVNNNILTKGTQLEEVK